MARLQLLILPLEKARDGSELTPFALIFDELTEQQVEQLCDMPRDPLGARGVLAFSFTVDVV